FCPAATSSAGAAIIAKLVEIAARRPKTINRKLPPFAVCSKKQATRPSRRTKQQNRWHYSGRRTQCISKCIVEGLRRPSHEPILCRRISRRADTDGGDPDRSARRTLSRLCHQP